MKKFVVLTLFGLLIMAFSGTAYAQLQFKASGMIDFNTVINMNVPYYFANVAGPGGHAGHAGIFNTWSTIAGAFRSDSGLPTNAFNHQSAYAYSRGLLKFDAIVDKNLSGTIYFEIDAFRWGSGPGITGTGSGSMGLGSPGGTLQIASERNTMGVWSTDRAAVEVKNVYFDVGLPYFGIPVPMTVRIGAQPFGVRPQMLVYTDGTGITGGIKIDPVTIIPMWAKVNEALDWASDDADLYGLHVNAKLGTFTVGGYFLNYFMNTYPLQYATGWANPVAGFPAVSASYGFYTAGTQKANMWWFGLYADGKAGPINLNWDLVFDTGKVEQKSQVGNTFGSVQDVIYQGYATRMKLDYPWEKWNFGMAGMYASGADANRTSTGGLPGQPVANRGIAATGVTTKKVNSYVVPPGSEQSPAANESIVMYSCFNASADGGTGIANMGNYQQMSRGGFGGTAFIKPYVSFKAMPWAKLTLQGLYIWDTTKNGNTFGTAVKNPGVAFANQRLKDSDSIGFELDMLAEIDIYKNLKWYMGFGYLWAGSALDVYNGAGGPGGPPAATARNWSPQNPWNFTTRMIFTF